jgi:hypothetical protein
MISSDLGVIGVIILDLSGLHTFILMFMYEIHLQEEVGFFVFRSYSFLILLSLTPQNQVLSYVLTY